MYNLDEIVKIYYGAVSARMILDGLISYDEFSLKDFLELSKVYLQEYSETESRHLYRYMKTGAFEERNFLAGIESRTGLNVFAALEELAEQLLTIENYEVLCEYGSLLRLRAVTESVDEDLLVCAYLAVRYMRLGVVQTSFAWNTAIGHNNIQLRRIIERGISENHFHLFGSAPIYHLLWIHFMNHVDSHTLVEFTKRIEARQRTTREHYNSAYTEDSFAVKILKAAAIRIELIIFLWMKESGETENPWDSAGYDIEKLLSGEVDILEYCDELQNRIDQFRNMELLKDMADMADYAIYFVENFSEVKAEQRLLSGERWFMYKMLSQEMTGEIENFPKKYYSWFYAYLVQKQNIRSELVQLNKTVGFENFSVYSGRKSGFLRADQMITGAVYGSVESGNIRSLEIRISPEKKALDNAEWIQKIDMIIGECRKPFPKSNYYYVFHFPKKAEEKLAARKEFDGLCCRHYKRRKELEAQANEIYLFRENYRGTASRVLGLDACAQEIGCRPEVFAPVFRFLSCHTIENILGAPEVRPFRKTYHVGEDFLDIVDGLRAVDEAIRFLNLQCGDRIGHGTVLGIDVFKWYDFKRNTIVLPEQDYLDNVVWLYHKLVEYKLEGFDNLREELLKAFDFYFADIYLHRENGNREGLNHDIYTYYEAWKLRGDEPELYINGKFEDKEVFYDREWLVNRRFPENFGARKRDEISFLYYLYHYDWDVRNNGAKSTQVYILPVYIEGVAAVQKAMQKEFAVRGIGVETNPSSNLAISTIGDYSEHPIVNLYNKDLTWDIERLKACPQINVSINTDDKGIFHTSLENEYALMACAMEKVKDENGKPVYNRQMIYQWIDNIRVMGNLQSFRDINC